MFGTTYVALCEKNNVKPRALASELGAAPATVTRWQNGSVPGKEMLQNIAVRFNVTVDYLINDSDISLDINSKHSVLKKLTALPQRWASLHACSDFSKQQTLDIAEFVNATLYFINNENCVEYTPEAALPGESADEFSKETYDLSNILKIEVLFLILNLMDSCADTDEQRSLQIQLSRIVLYNLGIKSSDDVIIKECGLTKDKIEFLITGIKKADPAINYGLNMSDLSALYEKTGKSYIFMFTGIDGKFADIINEFASSKLFIEKNRGDGI